MSLSRPAPRKLLHMRKVDLRGYLREDGQLEVEAHMTDEKTFSFANIDRDGIRCGEALHDMWIRITLDMDLTITGCEASMDATPYSVCPQIAPNMSRLVGLKIGKGFLKEANARVAGVEGCTHLRELLQPLATTAFQTMVSIRFRESGATSLRPSTAEPNPGGRLLNTCHAYAQGGPIMTRIAAAGQIGTDEIDQTELPQTDTARG